MDIMESDKFHIIRHPLIEHKMTILRDENTSHHDFRRLTNELSVLLAYEATRHLRLTDQEVTTPLETTMGKRLASRTVILPILRAGLGMVDAFLSLLPNARVGHIGLNRDEETLQPHEYYYKLPERIEKSHIFLVDPMLGTGGTASAALAMLKKRNLTRVTFVCIVASPEGVAHVQEAHPDIPIYTASLDRQLNDVGYILPGLGDAGDRIFGTK